MNLSQKPGRILSCVQITMAKAQSKAKRFKNKSQNAKQLYKNGGGKNILEIIAQKLVIKGQMKNGRRWPMTLMQDPNSSFCL